MKKEKWKGKNDRRKVKQTGNRIWILYGKTLLIDLKIRTIRIAFL